MSAYAVGKQAKEINVRSARSKPLAPKKSKRRTARPAPFGPAYFKKFYLTPPPGSPPRARCAAARV